MSRANDGACAARGWMPPRPPARSGAGSGLLAGDGGPSLFRRGEEGLAATAGGITLWGHGPGDGVLAAGRGEDGAR